MDKTIRFGVIGCSEEAERHLIPMPPRDIIEVTALCDVDHKRRQALADKLRPHNGGQGFIVAQTLEAILPDVDAVFITHYHAEQISLALHEGKHVLMVAPSLLGMEQFLFFWETTNYARDHHLYFFIHEPRPNTTAMSSFIQVLQGEIDPDIFMDKCAWIECC